MPPESGAAPRGPVTLPTGTVTFLFSDIEGSTQRWETHREAMASAVARHDALMRAASERHGGFVFKTVGDAFCIAFRQPEAAVAAALDAQLALNVEDFSSVDGLRVRMALHTGTADERNGDFFGPAVNRVARLLGIGHGGQVLVSGTATDLLQGMMPPQSSLRDLGQHRLRDLSRPEQVYQLIASGLPDMFPQPRSLDVLPNNLPRQATSFIGRDDVLAELKALLAKSQVVTIVTKSVFITSGYEGRLRRPRPVSDSNRRRRTAPGWSHYHLWPLRRSNSIGLSKRKPGNDMARPGQIRG